MKFISIFVHLRAASRAKRPTTETAEHKTNYKRQ